MSTKGKSGNTGGGTETSFTKTPQARDDLLGSAGSSQLDYNGALYLLDVMANDLGGNAKALWSVDDGINQSGAMSGHEAGDLLSQDQPGVTGLAANVSRLGAALHITADGKVAYDSASISGQAAADLTALAVGQTLSDSFIYAIRLANGTLSWARAEVVLTGVNDRPVVQALSVTAVEDGAAVTGNFDGDDVDSDDDAGSLTYTIVAPPAGGSLVNNDDGSFSFDPGNQFQQLAEGETLQLSFDYTATDSHGATSAAATVSITVTGVNDDPTLAAGSATLSEDTAGVSVDLAALGDDIDNDDDGSSLQYTLQNAPAAGSAVISGTSLQFSPGTAYQSLAAGASQDVVLQLQAADGNGSSATNSVTITVTGVNDAPVLVSGDSTGSVTATPGVLPFTVQQYTGYTGSTALASLQAYAAANTANYTTTTTLIDYTDDPAGFAGEIPGSVPWPAAAASGSSGTDGINNYFFARISGQINIAAADTYTFRTFNDDGVYVRVNNQLVINDPGVHPEQAFQGSIHLTPGVYPVELYFFEVGGEASLEFSYRGSSGSFGHVEADPVLRDNGVLVFADVDAGDTHTVGVSAAAGTLGTLTTTLQDTPAQGGSGQVAWAYAVDNAAVASLGQGQSKLETFTVSIDDGNGGVLQQEVTVTIAGANDVAVLGSAAVSLTETNEAQSIGGTLSISDADAGEAVFNVQSGTAGSYGSFSIAANGEWSYSTNGALDQLAPGQVVGELFNVTSADGTASTVTITITGTADGPQANADQNLLLASKASAAGDTTVYWVDWTSSSVVGSAGSERNPIYQVQGSIALPGGDSIEVTYTGQYVAAETQLNGGTYYYTDYSPFGWGSSGPVYTSTQVANAPDNSDLIALHHADTPRTLSFSDPVENLFFAIVSMNDNGYVFDQDFDIVSSGIGYFGGGYNVTKQDLGEGRYGISSTGSPGYNEFHGVLAIDGAVESLTWESQADEYWNGFTIGTYGPAESATASGNLLDNDSGALAGDVLEISFVNGTAIAGNSVTINLASGAILKVDSDGDYLFDDNNAYSSLPAGESVTESISYTITDQNGQTDEATLQIVIVGTP